MTQTINILEEEGISWNFDSASGWALVDTISDNTDSSDITFVTVDDSITVMRVQADSALGGDMAAIISSNKIDTLIAGDYQVVFRFRNGTGGLEANPGALETRVYIQDYPTWTDASLGTISGDSARQLMGIFKGGGIFTAPWANGTLSDTDPDNDWADSGEWVEVTINFSLTDTLYDQAVKLQVRIGTAHSAMEDVTFEFDYFDWTMEVAMDTMTNDTMTNDTTPLGAIDTTFLGRRGIDWQFDSMQGWSFVDSVSSNASASDWTFNTVDDSVSVMRMTAPMGLAADMSAVISSAKMDTIPSGEYHIFLRFRNGAGGAEANPGPLEIRTFLQDHSTWTTFNPDAIAAGQVLGIFKLGGISPTWPGATISDSDTTDDFADTGEWVEIEFDFDIVDTLYDKAFKFLIRIGTAHAATEDVNFEIDYIDWREGALPMDTMTVDTMTSINDYVSQNSIKLFPNPTKELANLRFDLSQRAEVALDVYSISGQRVKGIDPKTFGPGRNELKINLSGLKGGLYLYQLKVNDAVYMGKLSVLE